MTGWISVITAAQAPSAQAVQCAIPTQTQSIRKAAMSEEKSGADRAEASIANKLFDARKVLICEEINQTMAKRVIGQLLALAEASSDPIQLFVNSQGGHVEAGDSIHDMIGFIQPKVQVIGTGYVASAGTHIFLAAEKEDRYCLPNTRFLIHQPSGGAGGSATDIAIQAEQIVKMKERLAQVISNRSGTDIDRVRLDIERDKWMDTAEAIEYGLVSQVISSAAEIS
jgi:ATP-dependent Clp protease protease subunit